MISTSIREEVILSHMPQVQLLARHLHRRCPQVELEDLISVGTIGLIQAIDRFSTNIRVRGYLPLCGSRAIGPDP
jgi:DNA-directed RNA polymerase specialized sigma subunit